MYEPAAATSITGYTSGEPEALAHALIELYTNPDIDGILCSIGGFNSKALLPFLDYDAIRNHPKVLVGYSDATALLVAILVKSFTVTFHGPAVLPEWGEFPEPLAYTLACFTRVTGGETPYTYHPPASWTHEFLEWGSDRELRARRALASPGWRTIIPGRACGRLMGGNVETLNMLAGTPYLASLEKSIIFLEATDAEAYLPRFDRALTHLEQAGVFRQATALLIGRCPDAHSERGVDLDFIARSLGGRLGIPVAADLDFGHTDPKMTLPLGIQAEIIAGETVHLTLCEPAVVEGFRGL